MKILPYILGTLTQHDRQVLEIGKDFEWSKDCWTYNAFRLYELLCGRRSGIRFEGASVRDREGNEYQVFGTYENFFAYVEGCIRAYFKTWQFGWKIVPIGQLAGLPSALQSPFLFAVAFDNAQTNFGAGATLSCTVTGSDGYMFAGTTDATSTTVGVFNLITMTVGVSVNVQSGFFLNSVYLASPSTGTHNLVSTSAFGVTALTYSGVLQAAPDASQTAFSTGAISINTSTANCWMVAFAADNNGTPTVSGGSLRANYAGDGGGYGNSTAVGSDSNGVITTGGYTITLAGNTGAISSLAYTFTQSVATVNSGFFFAASR